MENTSTKEANAGELPPGLESCTMKPIGVIRTPFPEPKGTPLEPSRAQGARGTVWIDAPFREALLDLEGFDRVWLLFWLHRSVEPKPLVTPFLDVKPHGLFATRAPSRFNPIGLSAVRLLAVHKDRIEVADVDIVDGTPLLDLKPYIPEFDSFPESNPGWFGTCKNEKLVADSRFAAPTSSDHSTLEMSIEEMKCQRCDERVREALKALQGIVSFSVERGSASVLFDPTQTSEQQILAAVTAAGFPARHRHTEHQISTSAENNS